MDDYEKVAVIGRGAHGKTYKAIHRATGNVVAIKKLRLADSGAVGGVSLAAIRELKILQELKVDCSNVVTLLDVFPHKAKLILVLEYCLTDLDALYQGTRQGLTHKVPNSICAGEPTCHTDLDAIIKDRQAPLSASQVRTYTRMALAGLAAIHDTGILHRDIKPDNMLVSAEGVLKLGDFGAARTGTSPGRAAITPPMDHLSADEE
eukprot:gene14971-21027_t